MKMVKLNQFSNVIKLIAPSMVAILFILIGSSGCGQTPASSTVQNEQGLRTWLLVRAPEKPLLLDQPVVVKSQTEDASGVSHVELYAVQLPNGENNLMLDSQQAALNQTAFTAEQTIIPAQRGHYAIKVVGYNKLGERAESETISFEVQ